MKKPFTLYISQSSIPLRQLVSRPFVPTFAMPFADGQHCEYFVGDGCQLSYRWHDAFDVYVAVLEARLAAGLLLTLIFLPPIKPFVMERFDHFWARYCTGLADAPRRYLYSRHTLKEYPKGACIKLPGDYFPYYCVVLGGLVGGYQTDHAHSAALRDLILPLDFFTGTEHPFTRRTKSIEYRALAATVILQLPIATASEGQSRYPEIAELFHVMKQRKINQLRKLLAVYQETDSYARYCVYRQVLPIYSQELPHRVQEQLLRLSHSSYQRVKARYLRDGK